MIQIQHDLIVPINPDKLLTDTISKDGEGRGNNLQLNMIREGRSKL